MRIGAVRLALSRHRHELPPTLAPSKRCVGERLRERNMELCRLRAMGMSQQEIRSKFGIRQSVLYVALKRHPAAISAVLTREPDELIA
jgi:hypothetical protein